MDLQITAKSLFKIWFVKECQLIFFAMSLGEALGKLVWETLLPMIDIKCTPLYPGADAINKI